jgi:hypothetical protein
VAKASTKEPIFEGMYYREEIRKHPTVEDYVLAKKETVSRKTRNLEFYPTNMEWFGASLKRFGSAMSGHPELCDRTPVFPLVAGQVAQQLFGISLSDFYSDPKMMVKMAVAAAELYDMAPFATAIYVDPTSLTGRYTQNLFLLMKPPCSTLPIMAENPLTSQK